MHESERILGFLWGRGDFHGGSFLEFMQGEYPHKGKPRFLIFLVVFSGSGGEFYTSGTQFFSHLFEFNYHARTPVIPPKS